MWFRQVSALDNTQVKRLALAALGEPKRETRWSGFPRGPDDPIRALTFTAQWTPVSAAVKERMLVKRFLLAPFLFFYKLPQTLRKFISSIKRFCGICGTRRDSTAPEEDGKETKDKEARK